LFGVLFHATDNNLEDSMWYLMDNLVRLCHDVTDEEVERAKQIIKTSYLVTKGDGAANAAHNAAQLATSGRVQTTAEVFTRLDVLTTSDVKAVANKYINDEDHALAAVGPIFELPDYNWIRRRSYWHRF
jgi:mitochondrial-processing peptidase subunit beta